MTLNTEPTLWGAKTGIREQPPRPGTPQNHWEKVYRTPIVTYWVGFYSFLNKGGEGKEAETQNEIFTSLEKCSCMTHSALSIFERVFHAHCLSLTPPVQGAAAAAMWPHWATQRILVKNLVPTSLSTPRSTGQEPGGSQWKQRWTWVMEAERRWWMSARSWAEKGSERHKPRMQLEGGNGERTQLLQVPGSHHAPGNPGTEWLKSFQSTWGFIVQCTFNSFAGWNHTFPHGPPGLQEKK